MLETLVTDDYVIETLYRRWGLTAKKIGHEFHSGCPECGGSRRAWVSKKGRFTCRECGFEDWLDSDKPFEKDPLKIKEIVEQNLRAEKQRQEEISKRLKDFETQAEKEAYILGRDDERKFMAKKYFNSQGIDDWLIQYYGLGYDPHYKVKTDESYLELPAYTIPIREPIDWKIVNCQYRIADPVPDGVGKYRQAYHLPASSFFAEQSPEGFETVFAVEGSKKAIVHYEHIDGVCQTVGFPGCSPSERLLKQLTDLGMKSMWLILDPGCNAQEQRIKSMLPNVKVHIIRVPDKIDDMWKTGSMTASRFKEYERQAR